METKKELPKFNINNIPLPPKSIKVDETGYKKPNIFLKYYLMPIFIILFNIGGLVFLFSIREVLKNWFYIILVFYIGLALPLFLGIAGYSFIRLYLDKNRILNKIIPVLPKNFIKAIFFLPQKKQLERICLLNNDGISFNIKDAKYIIDADKIFFDEQKYPCGYWLPNIPNQIGFNLNDEKQIKGINYSSQNLEIFFKDKMFKELHQQITPETLKLLYMAFGIIGLFIVALIIIIAIK